MSSKPQAERVYYSFNPSPSMLENLAKPSGPRPTLVSAFYLIGEKGDKVTEGLKTLEQWRKYSQPYDLMIDSGVYTIRAKMGFGIHEGAQLKNLTEEGKQSLIAQGNAQRKKLDEYVKKYCEFLKLADGMYDSAVEMDVDHFLGADVADEYYDWMVNAVDPKLVMRVFHQSYRTWEDWVEWMKNPETAFHCMEGGIMHRRDPQFYRHYINTAHKYGKRIHVLALTVPDFMKKVPADTVDSSTFVNGGRYGSIKVPGVGEVTFSSKTDLTKNSAATHKHYTNIPKHHLEMCKAWFKLHGYTMEQVLEDHYVRSILNIFYHDVVVDVPYQPQSKSLNVFSGEFI